MIRILIIFSSLFFILNNMNLNAQSQLKVGHVNIVEIISILPESDSAKVLLEKDTKELESMLENMQVEYNNLVNNYQQNLVNYSELVRNTKESELLEMQNKIQSFQENASQKLQQRNYELLQPIYDKVQKAINDVATTEEFTYILDISKGTVVFKASSSLAIDKFVLQKLGIDK